MPPTGNPGVLVLGLILCTWHDLVYLCTKSSIYWYCHTVYSVPELVLPPCISGTSSWCLLGGAILTYETGTGAGVADGIQKAWINGTPVFDRADVMFRYDAKFQIARLFFANFHGGKSSQFQPNHTEWVSYVPPSML